MMLLSYKLRRDLRWRRRIASLMAVCFVWFSCLGNLGHSHGGNSSVKLQASKALHQTLTASQSGAQVSNNVQDANSAPDHCAMCDWQNIAVTNPSSPTFLTASTLIHCEVPTFSALPVSLRLAILGGRAPPTV